jgi:polyisoprenoid-binding protein YceI
MFRKIATLCVGLTLINSPAFAEKYSLDASHSEIGFAVRHLGISNVKGVFDTYTGHIEYDGKDVSSFRLELEIDAASINTRNKKRDGHLHNEDFFDVKKFPKIKFTTTAVKGNKLSGVLTLKETSKKVTADIEVSGPIDSPFEKGVKIVGFTGTAKVNRQDFGVANDKASDKLIGDTVKIEISLEAKK